MLPDKGQLTLVDFAVDRADTLAVCIAHGASMYAMGGGFACEEEVCFWKSVASRFVGQKPSDLLSESVGILGIMKITTWVLADDSSILVFDNAYFEDETHVAGREFAIVYDVQEDRHKLFMRM